ncbi:MULTISPECIES: hypothetical protein [unclassified Bradyrhizobium]|uniref:hypothetical protein n=1 Tax=unclassified Bradyrhizobium TaxID=2631580 RepID=UPI0024793DCC|nr:MULTISPECIES: hypothetical protein [unclassified Bradyrhizobium]WGR72600.1 hypothetical protein MTX24_06585 [Bradyrhizobium sp. ISRA426]WGR77433.1 hypothetical protein MTX21_31535 [Bradyrhizobium sp. ISRA430]WGR87839.1 hypothetical protein MTX25_06585 [Bradyrhizobium sp. ISRA432]
MEILFELVFDGAEFIFGLLIDLIEIVGRLIGWLLKCFRRWPDIQPDVSWRKRARLSLGVGLSLCVLAPLLWLIWR